VDGEDYNTMAVLLDSEKKLLTKKKQSMTGERREPAWVRRGSLRQEEKDTRRNGSAWVGNDEIREISVIRKILLKKMLRRMKEGQEK
jgi:hypothetical protein